MTILSKLGLMKRSEHEAAINRVYAMRDEARIKQDTAERAAASYKADAELWRNARAKRSRDRKAAKGGVK